MISTILAKVADNSKYIPGVQAIVLGCSKATRSTVPSPSS